MGVYGIAVSGFFLCGISVILIFTSGIAVSSSSAVCGFSSFWLTVFGEIRSVPFICAFLSMQCAKQKTVGHKGRLDYQPLFGKMSPHSSHTHLFGEDQRPDPGDGGNRA